jgi:hypothetical protein
MSLSNAMSVKANKSSVFSIYSYSKICVNQQIRHILGMNLTSGAKRRTAASFFPARGVLQNRLLQKHNKTDADSR